MINTTYNDADIGNQKTLWMVDNINLNSAINTDIPFYKVGDFSEYYALTARYWGAMSTFTFVATGGQTTFTGADINARTLSYPVGFLVVRVNGVIIPAASYTASTGTSVVFGTGRVAGDVVVFQAGITTAVQFGVYTATGAGGVAVMAGGTTLGAMTSPLSTGQGTISSTLLQNSNTLFFRMSVNQGTPTTLTTLQGFAIIGIPTRRP